MEGIKTRIEPLEEARGEPRIGQVTLSSDAEHISKQKISEVKCVYFKMVDTKEEKRGETLHWSSISLESYSMIAFFWRATEAI